MGRHCAGVVGFLGVVALLGACSNPFPAQGPLGIEVRGHYNIQSDIDYTLLPLTDQIISTLVANEPPGFIGTFTDRRPAAEIRFGVGDIVAVTIFEAAAGGLFIPLEAGSRAGNFVTLPDQAVDRNGNIQIPYAGSVPTAGQTPSQVQNTIQDRLRNRAIDPQAVVTLREQRTSLVSVLGEVNQPTRLPVFAAGDRVLDAISRAGGPKFPGHETFVTLQRDEKKATIHFLRLISEPRNNIFVRPGDTLFLYREPQVFIAFGASLNNAQIPFEKERLSLAEAIGKAGGLLDERADPYSVFIYRLEPMKVAEAIGADVNKTNAEGMVPVVYSVNMRDPTGNFIAAKFRMRNLDVIYISNAPTVETAKILQFLRIAVASVRETNAAVHELRCKGAVGC
jgi:polysaccharide export outer membrane protein